MHHGHVAKAPGAAQHQPVHIGIGALVADDLIHHIAGHGVVAGQIQPLGLFQQPLGHFVVDVAAEAAEGVGKLVVGGVVAVHGVHRAVPLPAVGGGDGDGFAHGQRVGLNVYSQKSIQAQLCQAALVIHNVCHAVARFRIDGLDPAGNTGLDGGGNLVLAGLLELAVQVIQGVLNGGQAGQHGAGVGGGQKGARFNGVALLHIELFHLHGGGDGQVLHIVTGQAAAAGDGGLDGACGDGDGLDIAAALGRHGPLHPLPDIQCTGQSRYQDHGNNGDDPLNGFLPFLGFCWFGHREFLQNQLLMFIL